MTSETVKDVTTAQKNRVTLSNEALACIETWLDQINTGGHGVNVKRNELIDWLILNRKKMLTAREIKRIGASFFNDVAFTTWALKEFKASQKRGEDKKLAEYLDMRPIGPSRGVKQQRNKVNKQSRKPSYLTENAHKINEKFDVKSSNS